MAAPAETPAPPPADPGDERLPAIPVLDLGRAGPAALLEAERDRALALLEDARTRYPRLALRLGDRATLRWLRRSGNPYRDEIADLAARLGAPGGALLNLSHEWACTSAAVAPAGESPRLLRVLDWSQDGLGRHLVAARHRSAAGPWINLTWPGFVGCVQGVAPGRFAAAFNQAPMRRRSPSRALDWTLDRSAVWRRRGLPPAHLLRRVFETCPDYAAAERALRETPVALPTLFILVGLRPGEGCVIERRSDGAGLYPAPAAVANDWLSPGRRDRPRGDASGERRRCLAERLDTARDDLAWLAPPVLNPTTRLALLAQPAAGRLTVRGFERDGPATRTLRLESAA